MRKVLANIVLMVSIFFSSFVYANKQQKEVDFLDKVLDDKPIQSPQKVAIDKPEKALNRKKRNSKNPPPEETSPPVKPKAKPKTKKAKKPKVEAEPQKEEEVQTKEKEPEPIKKGLKSVKNGHKSDTWVHEEFIVTPDTLPKYEKKQSDKKEEPLQSSPQDEQKSKITNTQPIKEKNVVPVIPIDKQEDTTIGKFFSILSENKKVLIIFGLVTLFALYRWKYNSGKSNAKTTTFTRLKR